MRKFVMLRLCSLLTVYCFTKLTAPGTLPPISDTPTGRQAPHMQMQRDHSIFVKYIDF